MYVCMYLCVCVCLCVCVYLMLTHQNEEANKIEPTFSSSKLNKGAGVWDTQ